MISTPRGVPGPVSQVEDAECGPFRFNNKLDMFVSRCRHPPADPVDAVVAQWDQYTLVYAFAPLKFLRCQFCRIRMEGILVKPYCSALAQLDVVHRPD